MHYHAHLVRVIMQTPIYLHDDLCVDQYAPVRSRLAEYQEANDPGLIAKRNRERAEKQKRRQSQKQLGDF